jgi:hypothetical protein
MPFPNAETTPPVTNTYLATGSHRSRRRGRSFVRVSPAHSPLLHAYALPGTYVATLDVCDKNGGCDSDSRTVVVTKRDTTLGYTGPLSSNPSKTIDLTANLDEYGEAVVGRKVTFAVGSQTAIGTTDATGKASVSLMLNQKQGSYPFSATFPAGDPKYNGSLDSGTFVIGK